MNNKLQELADAIAILYDEKQATKAVANILYKINETGGSYRDVYEYIRQFNLGNIFTSIMTEQDIQDISEVAQLFVDASKRHYNDITDQIERIQISMNEAAGEHIKPVKVPFEEERVRALFGNSAIENLESDLLKFFSSVTDEILESNAEIQRKLGFDIVIVRRYDDIGLNRNFKTISKAGKTYSYGDRYVKECQWCKSLAKAVNYDDIGRNRDIFRRHSGCSCSIDYVNKGRTERVQNYRKNINRS